MASGISVPIGADASEFATAVKSNMVAPLQEAVDALSALGEDASFADVDSALRQVQSNLKEVRADANDAAKGIRQTLIADGLSGGSSVTEQLQQTAAGGKAAAEGIESVKEKGSELAEGLKMNASFGIPMLATQLGAGEGGLAGAASSTAEALSGMGMMMGPEVAIPAAALGAVVAFLASKLGDATAESAALQASVGAMVDSMVNGGEGATSSAEAINKSLQSIADNSYKTAGGTAVSFTQMQSDAKELGVSVTTLMQAYAGVPAAVSKVNDATEKQSKYVRDNATAWRDASDHSKGLVGENTELTNAISRTTKNLDDNSEAARKAAGAYDDYEKAQQRTAKQTTDLKKTLDDATEANDSMQESVESSMNLSGKALDQVLDRSKKDADAILETQQKALTANEKYLDDFNAAVKNGLDEAGQQYVVQNRADFQEVIDTYGASSPQAKQYIANANKLGADSSSSFASQFQTGVADAMAAAAETVANQKFLVKMGVDSSGLSADMINAAAAARRAAQTYINNSPIIVPVTSGKIGVKMQ